MGDTSKSDAMTKEALNSRPKPNADGYRAGMGRGAELPTVQERRLKPRMSLVDIRIDGKEITYDAQIYSMVVRAGMAGGTPAAFKQAAELTADIQSDKRLYHQVVASLAKQAGMAAPVAPNVPVSLPTGIVAVHDDGGGVGNDEFPEDPTIELTDLVPQDVPLVGDNVAQAAPVAQQPAPPVVNSAAALKAVVEGPPRRSTQVEKPAIPAPVAGSHVNVKTAPVLQLKDELAKEDAAFISEVNAMLDSGRTQAMTESVVKPSTTPEQITQEQSREYVKEAALVTMKEIAAVMGDTLRQALQAVVKNDNDRVKAMADAPVPVDKGYPESEDSLKPELRVSFKGPFGTMRTRYHNADLAGEFLVLVFDSRCEQYDIYEPPAMTELIEVVIQKGDKQPATFYCKSLGMNLDLQSRGLYLVVLLVVPEDREEVQLLQAEKEGAFDEERSAMRRLES